MAEIKTVVVLGMHRSGTSMVARILSILGVNMGRETIGKKPGNIYGHFEDVDFLKLNMEIMEAKGITGFDSIDPLHEVNTDLTERIRTMIGEKTSSVWGWKDPRTCLTISCFYPFLINHYFIVCRRDKEEILCSLLRRNSSLSREKAVAMYDVYNGSLDNFLAAHPGIRLLELQYAAIVSKPIEEIKRISMFLRIGGCEEASRAASTVVTQEQKHRIRIVFIAWNFLRVFWRIITHPGKILKLIRHPQKVLMFIRRTFS